jgi:hypothetical protein
VNNGPVIMGRQMKKHFLALLAASAAFAAPTAASATDLLNITNPPNGSTSYGLGFTAGSANTTVTFGGYDPPSFSGVVDVNLHLQGDTTNLLGGSFAYTPAACGAFASQGPAGAFGTNNLNFGGLCTGSYDLFSQSFASTVGGSYVLDFIFNSSGSGNLGLLVQASDASVAGVPEPATWMMMLLGFGGMGMAMRQRKRIAAFG